MKLGKEKYQKMVESLFDKSPVVSSASIRRILAHKNDVRQYYKQLLRNLIMKGRIRRIKKGYYTRHEDPSLAVFCFGQAYLGLQDSLSFHSLWEQESIPIIITTQRVRQGIRNVLGGNVLIRRMDKKYFFGYNFFKDRMFYLPYSDIEKTYIDMFYFREKLDEETLEEIRKRVDKRKLDSYLKVYPERFKDRVLKACNQNT